MPPKRTLILGAHGQLGRALSRALPAAECVDRPTSSTSPTPHQVAALAVARVRAGPERRRLHRRRPGRDPCRASVGVGDERGGAGDARHAGAAARLHPRPLLHRLRLRRHPAGAPRGRTASPRSASTARPRRPVTSRWPRLPATTCSAPPGWSATATTSSAPWPGSRPPARARRSSTTRSAASPSPTSSPGRPCTCSTPGAPYGTYNCSNAGSPTSWADVARQVFELSGRSADDVTSRLHGRVRRRQGPGPAAGQQRARPDQAGGHRVPTGGQHRGPAPLRRPPVGR